MKSGQAAGTITSYGYIQICLDWRMYKAHRLAWLYIHGHMPERQLDHINHNRTDNRISNLREATPSENAQNRVGAQRNSKSGILGVHKFKNKWRAFIQINGKTKNIGDFDTSEQARDAYLRAKRQLHPYWNI